MGMPCVPVRRPSLVRAAPDTVVLVSAEPGDDSLRRNTLTLFMQLQFRDARAACLVPWRGSRALPCCDGCVCAPAKTYLRGKSGAVGDMQGVFGTRVYQPSGARPALAACPGALAHPAGPYFILMQGCHAFESSMGLVHVQYAPPSESLNGHYRSWSCTYTVHMLRCAAVI